MLRQHQLLCYLCFSMASFMLSAYAHNAGYQLMLGGSKQPCLIAGMQVAVVTAEGVECACGDPAVAKLLCCVPNKAADVGT